MSSWLAALGPCASPKSKAKERKNDVSQDKPLTLTSLKRRGSLTDIRNSRKVTGSRSFREKLQDTFDGSLRKAKKAGSLEAVGADHRGGFYGNPDTNMNVATSLSPKSNKGHLSGPAATTGQELQAPKDKFWTNFYNTLPRNRHKTDRPKDLSLQDLPVTEIDSELDLTAPSKDTDIEIKQREGQWSGYATSPRAKRKNKTLERMNSAPSTRKSPLMKNYDGEHRAASDGQASPQIIQSPDEVFDGEGFIVMPRSVSLQDEYWMPAAKGGSRIELRRVTPSPDRMMVRGSPSSSPMHIQGHVWVKTKDGAHMELRAIEHHQREQPSPSDSQKTDLSSLSYNTAASSLSHLEMVPKFPLEDRLPGGYASSTTQTPDQQYVGPYMSPEEYQANIFDLINSLNQSPPNPAGPAVPWSSGLILNNGSEGCGLETH